MKLLCITENYPPGKGGMSQSCDRIVQSLRKRLVEVDLFHFSRSKKSPNQIEAFKPIVQQGGLYIRSPRQSDMAHSLQMGLRFLQDFQPKVKYDFMLMFGGQLPLVAAPVYSKLLDIPYILCLRGNDFDHSLFDHKRKPSLDAAVRQSQAVCTVSKDKVDRLRILYPGKPVYYTPNGIDLGLWEALPSEIEYARKWREATLEPAQKVIGIFGHLKNKKAIPFFLNALLNSTFRDKIFILCAGQVDQILQDYFEVNELHHTILPFQDRSELIKHYLACDWVAIPSFYDGMPNVMLEAGALGIPVIGSNVDGMRDLLEDRHNGLLFSSLNEKECSLAIRDCARMDESDQKHCGQQLRIQIKKHFTAEDEVNNYIYMLETEHDKFRDEKFYSNRDSIN